MFCNPNRCQAQERGQPKDVRPGSEACNGLQDLQRLPENDTTAELSAALAEAVSAQGTPEGVVMMLVQPSEKNSYDQYVRPFLSSPLHLASAIPQRAWCIAVVMQSNLLFELHMFHGDHADAHAMEQPCDESSDSFQEIQRATGKNQMKFSD